MIYIFVYIYIYISGLYIIINITLKKIYLIQFEVGDLKYASLESDGIPFWKIRWMFLKIRNPSHQSTHPFGGKAEEASEWVYRCKEIWHMPRRVLVKTRMICRDICTTSSYCLHCIIYIRIRDSSPQNDNIGK